jgi:hypothetical protein
MIVDADYLIDDRSRHFARFRGTGILFTAPHNARERAPLRANNWDEVLALLPGARAEEERPAAAELARRVLTYLNRSTSMRSCAWRSSCDHIRAVPFRDAWKPIVPGMTYSDAAAIVELS